ncbi:MAG: hypothetical protein A3G33_06270 [Omnitrophica bacterium RIFCSPLOWO2_12_FULL_44_17]|uniref:PilZ domain-containing protein n=1 Tax=Candidatus Danuiimicrobium aquiferis TaxID=1801832 RepID=A0A1G1KWE5_9BACT|nr:MAG: hypothetical protein A3B72_04815 [Omnitrophica bacterium RIFCSPHIGHO2_02_FULL_45_28]OGW88709.1 MAG: hypothetical protein A3E74_09595 [Omnitrophica bacterium RIFCSPHIGHO2_12_FULL_44_12]OGW96889.1 MAG: hypothetical protein A3G33_06270 [Omnitrophica bacterium RIFCSPLOWO2_12_FULL_44_17]OGX02422.1 MAG: hypothetical protein A3J12_05015 [Omnitrophica bacterium RIFCSPLOWO2_02_FULL_44_11]
MNANQERRQYERLSAQIETEVTDGKSFQIFGYVRDVSLSGLFVTCHRKLAVGTVCQFLLSPDEDFHSDSIRVIGRVVRVDDDGMGVQFMEAVGDNFNRLRDILKSYEK